MTAHFPRVTAREVGYEVEQVDLVVAAARRQFADPALHELSARGIRNSEFSLAKGGYSITAVDEAIARLDDAFALQEIKRLLAQTGQHGLEEKARHVRELIDGRLARKRGRKFKRVSALMRGYSSRQVDRFLADVSGNLQDSIIASELPAEVEKLRSATFSSVWGGYAEEQVDAVIDRLVYLAQLRSAI